MAEPKRPVDRIQVTLRYFAAAGAGSETVVGRPGANLAEPVDGVTVRDETASLQSGDTIDVLPPFAGARGCDISHVTER